MVQGEETGVFARWLSYYWHGNGIGLLRYWQDTTTGELRVNYGLTTAELRVMVMDLIKMPVYFRQESLTGCKDTDLWGLIFSKTCMYVK